MSQLITLASRQLQSDAAERASGGTGSMQLESPASTPAPASARSMPAPAQVIRPRAEVGRVTSVPTPGGSPPSSPSSGQGFRPVKRIRGAYYLAEAAAAAGGGAHTLLRAESDNSQSFAFNHRQPE